MEVIGPVLQVFCKPLGGLYVARLTALVSAAEQDHHERASLHVVHAVAWPIVYTHFLHAVTDRLVISEITIDNAFEAQEDF